MADFHRLLLQWRPAKSILVEPRFRLGRYIHCPLIDGLPLDTGVFSCTYCLLIAHIWRGKVPLDTHRLTVQTTYRPSPIPADRLLSVQAAF